MLSAIVTGATGILGREIVAALGKDPKQWQAVHALSRSQKEDYPQNVQHTSIDLTSNAQDMAKQLQGVEAEYVFFAAYLQKDTEEESRDVNGAMLKNFLGALAITGAEKSVKRIILTIGAKYYGVHLGPTKNPMEETDRRIDQPGHPPNFYYTQIDILRDAAQQNRWDYVVLLPNDVVGVAQGNFMNLSTSLGLYAAITKSLGQELAFPGSEDFYTRFDSFTYSRLYGEFNIWAALEPRCGNQLFNVVNGDAESWQNLWPKIAKRFGIKIPPDQFSTPASDSSMVELEERPPIAEWAAEIGLEGRISRGKIEQRIDLTKWSQKDEVKQAWKSLAAKHGLDEGAFEKATWGFLGFVLGRNYDIVISMSKARKLGWTGYVDTWDALLHTWDELEQLKVLPTTK